MMAGRLATRRTHAMMLRRVRWHSTAASKERMRIAIVGGGVAGLTSALHLAPLVEKGLVSAPIDVYEGGPPHGKLPCGTGAIGRDVGVGVWSTALKPLRGSTALDLAMENLTRAGRWVGEVGYRTPNGAWLAKSTLPSAADDDLPGLLFLREKDLLMALRQAVHLEERAGTVKIHWDKTGDSTHAKGIWKDTKHFSAPLSLDDDTPSDRDYHLIVAADGMLSTLRQTYGGHRKGVHLTGTSALPNPFGRQEGDEAGAAESSWKARGRGAANAIEDRKYTVFRGNADMTIEETGMDGVSFQTWGVGKSMRFATVPMCFGSGSERVEKQVWFVTTSDDTIASEPNAYRRHEMILASFAKWHHPIPQLLHATPPEEILMERAVAHKYSMGPVLNVNRILSQIHNQSSSGPGPALVFVGDSYMTVDPILAQGFTMAMESAYELALSVETSLVPAAEEPSLAFSPSKLQKALQKRHALRGDRLLCLLRATELVQSLGQPNSRTVSGFLSRGVVRPLMRLSPDFVKRPIFDSMLKYSLGVH